MAEATTIRDLLLHDPTPDLPNQGVAEMAQESALSWELEHFVCKGQFQRGLVRILESYLRQLPEGAEQPAVWVSGFYGSGKSHLIKVLRYLWTDHPLPGGATARGVTDLPLDVADAFRELDTHGKRYGGLRAAAGTLETAVPLRRGILRLLLQSEGLPGDYAQASLVLWLRREEQLDRVRQIVEAGGRDWHGEVRRMYVSPVLAAAMLEAMPGWARDQAQARASLQNQFPAPASGADISQEQLEHTLHDLLAVQGRLPCTLLVLDEMQQYIGDSSERASEVLRTTEWLTKHLNGRLLLVAAGQDALSATPLLQKLQDRFPVRVQLSDAEVEEVTRAVVLAKRPERMADLDAVLADCSGEIDRHLTGSRLAPSPEDAVCLPVDYPLLPVRRRFWEHTLRALDKRGTAAQLRTQLRIIHEATKAVADKPVGTVIPADFIYSQIATNLLQSAVLLRDIHESIKKQDDNTAEGSLRARACALIYLIGELPSHGAADLGVRANTDTLADLLVEDLRVGGTELRLRLPGLLADLTEQGVLMQLKDEYRMQTRESAEWQRTFIAEQGRLRNDQGLIGTKRTERLRKACTAALGNLRIAHGQSKESRKIRLNFEPQPPADFGSDLPVWIRYGWEEKEKDFVLTAQAAGAASPLILVLLPRHRADDFGTALIAYEAAHHTLETKGMPTSDEGQQAYRAMTTRRERHEEELRLLEEELLREARVYQAGGNRVEADGLVAAVQSAAENAAERLFPKFRDADHTGWAQVFTRAQRGDGDPLGAVGHQGEIEAHPVCRAVLQFLGAGKRGSEVRQHFLAPPYGWPQDAVDAALLLLVSTGHATAHEDGTEVDPRKQQRGKLGGIRFRPVSVTLTVQQRLDLRGLLHTFEVDCRQGEEVAKLPVLLSKLRTLGAQAGGEAPAPLLPSRLHLDELEHLSGNEQALAVWEQREQLREQKQQWEQCATLLAQRRPRWELALNLREQATGLPVADQVAPAVEALREHRGLLNEPDSVPPLVTSLADALRTTLTQAYQDYQEAYTQQSESLTASESWGRVGVEQREEILDRCELRPSAAPPCGTPEELLESLRRTSLADWRSLRDALTARFARAREEATRLLQPQAVRVTLPHCTLSSEAEAEAYLEKAREQILPHLREGRPVIL